ncbi:PilN domain-containing protein [Desulfobacterota bacterium M19]
MIERINLAPTKSSPGRTWAVVYIFTALFFVIAGLVLYTGYRSTVKKMAEINQAASKSAQSDNDVIIFQARIAVLKRSIASRKNLIRKLSVDIKKSSNIKAKKHYYSRVLQSIAERLPKSVKCNKIAINGNTGSINGIATLYDALPEFVDKLNRDRNVFSSAALQTIGKLSPPLNTMYTGYNFKIVFILK